VNSLPSPANIYTFSVFNINSVWNTHRHWQTSSFWSTNNVQNQLTIIVCRWKSQNLKFKLRYFSAKTRRAIFVFTQTQFLCRVFNLFNNHLYSTLIYLLVNQTKYNLAFVTLVNNRAKHHLHFESNLKQHLQQRTTSEVPDQLNSLFKVNHRCH